MFKNYIKIALRVITKHRFFSVINISGLAVGIACCILVLLWIKDETSYDRFHVNAPNIYRVLSGSADAGGTFSFWDGTPGLLGPALESDYPEIEDAARIVPQLKCPIKYHDKKFYADCVATESSFLHIFSFPFIRGDADSALEEPGSIVLTESLAEKYFGNEDPVGHTVNLNFWKPYDLKVTGVIQDVPLNSHLQFDCLIHFSVLRTLGWDIDKWGGRNNKTYVLLGKEHDYNTVERKIEHIYKQHYPETSSVIRLEPITRIHLHNYNGGGAVTYIYILSILGIFILLIACVNFMNLSTARSSIRIKEVGLRKVVGAKKTQLRLQFLGESILLSFFSLTAALILARIFLPLFNEITDKRMSLTLSLPMILSFILIALVTALLAGSYPAFYLSAFHPNRILKGTGSMGRKTPFLRKGLVIFQFTISTFLIILAVTVFNQMEYIRNKDLGYNKNHVLVLQASSDLKTNYPILKQKLLENPRVQAMSLSNSSFLGRNSSSDAMDWEGKQENQKIQMLIHSVDYDYLDTFGLQMISGRFFSRENVTDEKTAVILNEAAVKAMDVRDPLGLRFFCPTPAGNVDGRVIGVVKDYHVSSLHEDIKPLVLVIVPGWFKDFYIRIHPEGALDTIAFIGRMLNDVVPDYVFDYRFLDESVDRLYRTELSQGKISRFLTFLSIFISCLGLFGLVAFTTEKRTKEIGIRKVLGASVPEIARLLSKEFSVWVIAANVFAWPAAYFFLNRWLRDFAYRISIGIPVFLLSGFAVLVIALLTVSFQTVKAARSNPADSLRYE